MTLRRQIALLNVVVLISLVAVIGWAARATYDEQIAQLEAETRAVAATLVVYLERGLALSSLQTVIENVPLPEGSVITVTDASSRVLARSLDSVRYVGRQLQAVPRPPSEVPAFVHGRGADGVPRVFANAVYAGGPWLVSVGVPRAVANARIMPIYQRNLVIAAGFTLFTFFIQFFLLRRYVRAFDRAVVMAGRVAEGDLSAAAPTRMPSRELELIQHSVLDMVRRLRESREAVKAQMKEERRMRQELESLQQQVIRQERLAAIGVLVSGVAHELNNPLQAILGFSELLQLRTDVPESARRDLGLIQKESARASAIIRNLSRFSRQQTADATPVRLLDVVASVVELRQRRLDEDGISLDIQDRGDPIVLAVFAELQQVVLNFVINAEQAVLQVDGRRAIEIAVHAIDGCARLDVSDTGPGVPAADEPKLFQPFFTTKPVGEGTGLGLSVSYGIIHSHGGTIGYRRAPAGGAIFSFELPALPATKTA